MKFKLFCKFVAIMSSLPCACLVSVNAAKGITDEVAEKLRSCCGTSYDLEWQNFIDCLKKDVAYVDETGNNLLYFTYLFSGSDTEKIQIIENIFNNSEISKSENLYS